MRKATDEQRQQGVSIFKQVLTNPAKDTAKQVIEQLKEGNADAAYVFTILKKFSKIQEEVFKNDDVKDLAITEVSKYLEKTKTAELFGAKITVTEGSFWDYSATDDPYLDKMEAIAAELKELIKARKDEIQAKAIAFHNRPPSQIVGIGNDFNIYYDRLPRLEWDYEEGVRNTIPPIKKGKTGLRFSL